MPTPNKSPRDLAHLVYASFRDIRRPPTIEVLEELFQVLFNTSLEREEGTSPRCVVVFASPNRPDAHPPKLMRAHRWTYAPFATRVPLTVENLRKLAIASDPDVSSLAVYPDAAGKRAVPTRSCPLPYGDCSLPIRPWDAGQAISSTRCSRVGIGSHRILAPADRRAPMNRAASCRS